MSNPDSLQTAKEELSQFARKVDSLALSSCGWKRAALEWLNRCVTYLIEQQNKNLRTSAIVSFLRELLRWISWSSLTPIGMASTAVRNFKSKLEQAHNALIEREGSLELREQHDLLQKQLKMVLRRLEVLDPNDRALVRPIVNAAQCAYLACEAAHETEAGYSARLEETEESVDALLGAARTLYAELCLEWFRAAYELDLSHEFIARLPAQFTHSSSQRTPLRFVIDAILNLIRQAEEATADCTAQRMWRKTHGLLMDVAGFGSLGPRQQFDRALLRPLLKTAEAADCASKEGHAGQDLLSAMYCIHEVEELKNAVNDLGAGRFAQAEAKHSIGRRAAQIHSVDRNNFIKRANSNKF